MSPGGKLASWKEIAAYLDRSVRTVQRWERELGLPVYRLPGKKRDIVYAIPAEIDAWQEKNSHQIAENGNGNPSTPPSLLRRHAFRGIAAAIVFLVAAAAWEMGRPGPPASWRVRDNRLEVYDKDARKIWEHLFQIPLIAATYRPSNERVKRGPLAYLVDLDQNGETSLLFTVISAGNADPHHGELLCFGRKGNLRWSYRPERAMHYGSQSYDPSYVVEFFEVRGPDIWVVSHHWREFPSLVARVDSHGKVLSEFWMPGHISTLEAATVAGRRVLLVGGTNNENYSASLAVVDYAQPNGSAPAANEKYRCAGCPPGAPLAFFLFPRSDISQALDTRPWVREFVVRQDGFETVVSDRLRDSGLDFEGDAAFRFDGNMRLSGVEVGDSYVSAHDLLQQRGVIKHNMDRRKESETLNAVRYWDGSHFARLLDDSQLLAHLR